MGLERGLDGQKYGGVEGAYIKRHGTNGHGHGKMERIGRLMIDASGHALTVQPDRTKDKTKNEKNVTHDSAKNGIKTTTKTETKPNTYSFNDLRETES